MERQWVLPIELRQTLQVSSDTNLLQLFKQKNLGVAQVGCQFANNDIHLHQSLKFVHCDILSISLDV